MQTLAVIPSAIGPMQALIAILPQIIAAIGVVLGAAAVAVLKPDTYKSLGRYCWAHKMLTSSTVGCMAFLGWGGIHLRGEKAGKEQVGAPWTAFRGGVERTGAVPGASGPMKNPKLAWQPYMPAGTGVVSIDSSPAVVGNRVYFTVSAQSPFKKSGAIYCIDADTGGKVWSYTGEDMDKPVDPVFSSPAVGGGPPGNEARYLVCGEGYHVEQDSRLLCLDLDPVRLSGGKEGPKIKWSIPSTNHVESSPCIFEGKVYVGSGDDGYWCVELETGHVKFHIESDAAYIINEGPQVNELAKLAGKTVMVRGLPHRWRPDEGKEESHMFLDIREFKEVPEGTTVHPPPPKLSATARIEPLRNVIGKLVVMDAPLHKEQGGSRVKIEIPASYPDAESPPIAARINGEPRLIFGSGVGGTAVVCCNAETGKEIWKAKTAFPSFGPPTIAGDKILTSVSNATFIGSDPNPAGSILCYSAIDGNLLWEYKAADGILGAVAVKDGLAYACSRDKNLYVINVKDGSLVKKYSTGGVMVCSPAVTDKGVFMSTEAGKLFCIRRDTHEFNWSFNLTPGEKILSSPSVAGNKLFVGSTARGLFCVTENPDSPAAVEKPAPWSGLGGTSGRCNIADQKGPPVVAGKKADRLSEPFTLNSRLGAAPLAACGKLLYVSVQSEKPSLACVDTSTKKKLWESNNEVPAIHAMVADEKFVYAFGDQADKSVLVAFNTNKGEPVWSQKFDHAEQPALALAGNRLFVRTGAKTLAALSTSSGATFWKQDIDGLQFVPASAYGLLFLTVATPKPHLLCLDDSSGVKIWEAELPAKPLTAPTVSGDKIFIGIASKDDEGKVLCRKVTDGSAVWECDVDKAPASYLVAGGENLAFTVADGTVFVINTARGEQTHTVLLGRGGQAPALVQNTLLLGADNRIAGYDLVTSSWQWGFRDQNNVGKVIGAPLLAGETAWVATEKLGLIAVGGKDEPEPKPQP